LALSLMHNPPIKPPRVNVLGVGIHAVNMQSATEFLSLSIRDRRKGYVCVTGVHGVMEAQKNAKFRGILDRALLVTPDGMPTVWLGRLQNFPRIARVFGPDLMLQMCVRSVERGLSHFLYGGKPGVAHQLQMRLKTWFPEIRVVGTFTPPFRPLNHQEKEGVKQQVAKAQPDIIWVGLSTPKQEEFMAEMISELDCGLMIGVGAAFDIHTGHLKDAPNWIKNAGLQWAHRLSQEPSRLWKRYLISNSGFIWKLALQTMGLQIQSLSPEPLLFYPRELPPPTGTSGSDQAQGLPQELLQTTHT
jgi:N-acetylglucosaminyldiphosphoundecaprenol N-acetyl-beta-D-mannosaminyltransferase